MNKNTRGKVKKIIYQHIANNNKEYILVILIFIVGIFLGVMFINNIEEAQREEIRLYLNEFVEKFKNIEKNNNIEIVKSIIFENITLGVVLWFFGTTVIGIPIVFGIILYQGFCLGYTISSLIITIGIEKGLLFIMSSLVLQNLIFIPALIAIAVSGLKLYKSIVKNRKKENIKIEILRHTIFSIIMIFCLCIAGVIEIFLSTNILKKIIKYF